MKSHRLRRLSYLSRMALGPLLSAPLPQQKLVFCITNGRSGSARLDTLFDCIEGAISEHEPEPRFDTLMQLANHDPAWARRFLRYVKLPHIAGLEKPIYVETSHMFGKGYFHSMMELGVPFSLVLLRRDRRSIALSMLRLNSTPLRTFYGRRFYLRPSQAEFIKLPDDLSQFTDYQLCYWHVCETEARQKAYGDIARKAGYAAVDVQTETLEEVGRFESVLDGLGIVPSADDMARIADARALRVNERKSEVPVNLTDIDAEEAEILKYLPESLA